MMVVPPPCAEVPVLGRGPQPRAGRRHRGAGPQAGFCRGERRTGARRARLCSRAVRIDTVMFDVGGVLIVTPFEMAARFERVRGWAPGTLGLFGPFDPDRDLDWKALQAGQIDEDEYWQRQADRLTPILGLEGGDRTRRLMTILFTEGGGEIIRPEVWPCLDTLTGAGIRAAILSNHLDRFHQPQLLDRLLAHFEPVIDLSFAVVRKPEPAAFLAALERLGRPDPATVIHVDDQPAHIAGAGDAGLVAVRFDPTRPAESFADVVNAAGI